MGSVCCSARGTTMAEANGEILQRTIRYSPSWGVRWDNCGHVAGEETPVSEIVENVRRNNPVDNKSETPFKAVSEVIISGESFESNSQKSPLISENVGTLSNAHVSESPRAQKITFEVEETTGMPAALDTLPVAIIEPNVPNASYLSTSPLLPRSQLVPACSAPSNWSPHVPKSQFLRQGSGSQLHRPKLHSNFSASEGRSPPLPSSTFESTRVVHGGSLDNWSMQNFLESTTSTHRDMLSVEGELFDSHRHKLAKSHSRKSDSRSNELETCVICSKYLLEKSSFSSQKILPSNELSVVAILVCGHVYHAECLEHLTPEINKYDPQCPVCISGEQIARSAFEKLLKEELDLKCKKHRSRIGNSDIISLSHESTSKLEHSPSLRSSFSRPFLKRHISFRSKADSTSSETQQQQIKRRILPWSKSSK